ncbi:hypothetical protein pb186bvf_002653 [Paramecium bursaria]
MFSQEQKCVIKFFLDDYQKVRVNVSAHREREKVYQLIYQNYGCQIDNEGNWVISFLNYYTLTQELQQQIFVKLEKLPEFITNLLEGNKNNNKQNYQQTAVINKLNEQQKEAVKKAIKFDGRILIADDKAFGKTLTALAIVEQYKHLWPLLIICPEQLAIKWQKEIHEWLNIEQNMIKIIAKGDNIDFQVSKVILMSYKTCELRQEELKNKQFKVAIADECHLIKSKGSKRSLNCIPILKNCQHVVLLSGSPLQRDQRDIYNILTIIKPQIFTEKTFIDFGKRYCKSFENQVTRLEDNQSDNLDEIHFLLKTFIMNRANYSLQISLENIPIDIKCDQNLINEIQRMAEEQKKFFQQGQYGNLKAIDKLTGTAKIEDMIIKLKEIIEQSDEKQKIIFFAYHQEVITAVSKFCNQNNIKSMKFSKKLIDPNNFKNQDYKIAILSKSKFIGLELTAANIIVFGELYWNNGTMKNAIARCYRRGQTNNVKCYYLIGKETQDDLKLKILNSKEKQESIILDGVNIKESSYEQLEQKADEMRNPLSKQEQKMKKLEEKQQKIIVNQIESFELTQKNQDQEIGTWNQCE